jgi:serine/threonine protein kinase
VTTPVHAAGIGFLQHREGDCIKGRYEVLDHLGGGNFGSVYRVRDAAVGNVLACKEMHVLNNPATVQDERAAALDLFRREALNLATLRHPHIPAAYFEQEDGDWRVCPRCGFDFEGAAFCPVHGAQLLLIGQRYYLMMDFIDGPTLEEMAVAHLREQGRPLPEDQCLEWTAQIASALRSLHMVGIVHRDVKPDNIKLRAADNVAMLLDFGLTKKVEEAGGYGTARISGTGRFGTAGYAPEDPIEQQHPGRHGDIHALGMTLYRLVSGRDPQEEEQLREMRAQAPRYFNSALSPEVERIIQTATATSRTRRYESIDDFLADINELRTPQGSIPHAPPFTFSDGTRARTVSDLARGVEAHPEEALNYLFNGMFAGWLRQNGFAAPAQMAESVVERYAKHPPRALEMFRRALYPSNAIDILPRLKAEPATLTFGTLNSGEVATRQLRLHNVGPGLAWGKIVLEPSAASTATVSDGDQTVLPGLRIPHDFEGNDVTLELALDTGRVPFGAYSGTLLIETDGGITRVPVDYTVRPLELTVEPAELDFGTVLVGRRASRTLRVLHARESQKGQPRGTIYTGAALGGMVAPDRFEGEEPVEITVDSGMPDAVAKVYEGALQLDTNGGRLRVPVRYSFALPPGRILSLIGGAIAYGALGAAVLRLFYFAINIDYAVRWLWRPGAPLAEFQLNNPGFWLAGAVVGAFLLRRAARRGWIRPELEPTSPFAGFVLGAALSWVVAYVLHWGVWSLGDWLLRPPAQLLGSWIREFAPLGWGVFGAVAGALWGAARAFSATGRAWMRYVVYAILLLAFLTLLINALLATA